MPTKSAAATDNFGFKSRFYLFLIMLLSSVALFWFLYFFRSYDDSRLTSWADVYNSSGPLKTFFAVILMQTAAFFVPSLSMSEKIQPYFIFTLSFAASVPFWSEPEMIVDASRYFIYAKYLKNEGVVHFMRDWGNRLSIWTDMPFVPLLYGMLFKSFGEYRIAIQIFNSGLFASSALLTYSIGKELFDKQTGINAAFLFLGIPYLFTQVPLMLVDIPSLFFLLLSIYLFLLSQRKGSIYVITASASIIAAFFTKYSTWLMMTILPLIYATELFSNRRSGIERYALRGMIVFFISFFFVSLFIALKHDEMLKQIHLLISYQRPGLSRWGESLVSTWLFQVHPFVTILALISIYVSIRRKDISYVIIAWLVIIVLVLQIKRIRYIVMAFPMLAIMSSYGLMNFRHKVNVSVISTSIFAFSYAIAIAGFLPFMEHTSAANIRNAGIFIDRLDVDSVEVFTPLPEEYHLNPAVSIPLLDLFTKKRIIYHYYADAYPKPQDIETSRLRFTWEYRNPEYYQSVASNRRAIAVITDRTDTEKFSEISKKIVGLKRKTEFNVRDNAFAQQTLVTLYH